MKTSHEATLKKVEKKNLIANGFVSKIDLGVRLFKESDFKEADDNPKIPQESDFWSKKQIKSFNKSPEKDISWEEEFLKEFGNRRDMFVIADILAFIKKVEKEAYERGLIEGSENGVELFMDSYCEHGRKNDKDCYQCGRATVDKLKKDGSK